MCLDDVAEAAASSRRAAEGVRMSPTSANAGCEQAARPVVFVVFSGNFGPGRPIKGYANEVCRTAVQACANGTIDKRGK
jgi:hypothetical protein